MSKGGLAKRGRDIKARLDRLLEDIDPDVEDVILAGPTGLLIGAEISAGSDLLEQRRKRKERKFAKGGSTKPDKPSHTSLQMLRAATDTLANQVPFVSDQTRAGLSNDMLRPLGGFASQWMAPDEEGRPATSSVPSIVTSPLSGALGHLLAKKLGMRRSLEMPGLITETLGLPADFSDIYGVFSGAEEPGPAPDFAREAQGKTSQLREGMMDELSLDEPSGFKEHALESAGIMAGQLPVGGVPGMAAKAPAWLKRGLGPLSAAAEWFVPTIDPKMANYAMGTGFGATLGTGVEMLGEHQIEKFKDEVREQVELGLMDPAQAEEILNSLEAELGNIESPETEEINYVSGRGFAKGGRPPKPRRINYPASEEMEGTEGDFIIPEEITEILRARRSGMSHPSLDQKLFAYLAAPAEAAGMSVEELEAAIIKAIPPDLPRHAKGGKIGTLTALRQRLADLIAPSATVEGTGREMVPVEPAAPRERFDPATGEPLSSPEEITLESIRERIAAPSDKPIGTVSRRDVLQGIAGLASPIKLDPMALIGKELESLGTAVEAAPAAAKAVRTFTAPQLANALQIISDNIYEGSEDSVEILANLAKESAETPQLAKVAPLLARAAELERRVAYDELDYDAPEYTQGWEEIRPQINQALENIGRGEGLVVVRGHEPAEFGEDAIEFEERTPTLFAEPPNTGSRQELLENMVADFRHFSDEDGVQEINPEGWKKWAEDFGPRQDAILANFFGRPEDPPDPEFFGPAVLKKYGLTEADLDAFTEYMDGEMADHSDIRRWAEADPELRQKYHDLTRQYEEPGADVTQIGEEITKTLNDIYAGVEVETRSPAQIEYDKRATPFLDRWNDAEEGDLAAVNEMLRKLGGPKSPEGRKYRALVKKLHSAMGDEDLDREGGYIDLSDQLSELFVKVRNRLYGEPPDAE